MLLSKVISLSTVVAEEAGKIIRNVFSAGNLEIRKKENEQDLQTEADRSAQRYIVGSLLYHFPKLHVIGEEENEEGNTENIFKSKDYKILDLKCSSPYLELQEEDFVVWVDPLDGTKEYTQGLLDHVTVLIGIASRGKVLGGVIHQPYYNYLNEGNQLGRTIWAAIGGNIGGIELKPPPKDGFVVVTSRSHGSSSVSDAISSLQPTKVLKVGGAGYKVLLLAEGVAHAYVFASPGCKKWDTCGPQAILEACGGKLGDICGQTIPYDREAPHRNSNGVLAVASGVELNEISQKIPKEVKNNLKS